MTAVLLKQSTAATIKMGPFLDSGDGNTVEPSLTIQKADVRLSKNGGDMAAANADQGASNAGAPYDEIGYYDISLNTTDTNTLGSLKIMIHESAALPVWIECLVVTANVWDTLCGADRFDVEVAAIGNDVITAAAIAPDAIGSSELAASAVTEIQTGLATAAGLATVDDVVDAIKAKTDNLPDDPAGSAFVSGLIGGLNDVSVADIFETKITEAYSTKGEDLTLGNAVYELVQRQQAAEVDGTTVTIHERDGTTEAMTLTMDDATNPTSVSRAT